MVSDAIFEPVRRAYFKADLRTMFRELNGLWMTHVLESLERLQKFGFDAERHLRPVPPPSHVRVFPYAEVLRDSGINVERMTVALWAVHLRGKINPIVFEARFKQYLDSLPPRQKQEISDFLDRSLPEAAVYAMGPGICGTPVCEDARLHSKDGMSILRPLPLKFLGSRGSGDAPHGQAGWDIGLTIDDLHDLASQLNLLNKRVSKLGIAAHGESGKFNIAKPALATKTIPEHKAVLESIWRNTVPDAFILLLGCNVGKDADFVVELSKVFAGRRVVAFSAIQYNPCDALIRATSLGHSPCIEPGVRDTTWVTPSGSPDQEFKRYIGDNMAVWNDLKQLPWASEISPSRIVAKNGKVDHMGPRYGQSELRPVYDDKGRVIRHPEAGKESKPIEEW